jgi:hypothetical protein
VNPSAFLKDHGNTFHLSKWLRASLLLALFPVFSFAAVQARIYDTEPPSDTPLYSYEIVKSREGRVDTWNARFIGSDGKPFGIETTTLEEGQLFRYFLEQPPLGESAEVRKVPQGVIFRYLKNGQWKENFEKTSELVIVGPQLVEVLLANWDKIVSGKSLSLRFAVPDRLETIGFRISFEKTENGVSIFHFSPSSFFIRQFVSPLVLRFDHPQRKLLTMRGRSFLKKKKGEEWVDLIGEFRFTL